MKKNIIMSVVLSAVFILSGCKGNDDEKECEEKGTGWVWDVTKEECVATATTKEDCDKKGTGWTWDETNKVCNQKSTVAEFNFKADCETRGAGWIWDMGRKRCITLYVTIINSTDHSISFGSRYPTGGGVFFNLNKGKCASIGKQEFMVYSLFFQITASLSFPEFEDYTTVVICDTGENDVTNTPCPSNKGVYEVSPVDASFMVSKISDNKTVEELKKMGCLSRYNIMAEGTK